MSRLETEARDLLLRRRTALRRQALAARAAGPEGHWTEVEALPEGATEQVRRELTDIDAALARIADGRYGACLACGGPLGLQRLRAIPEARYCLGCSGQAAFAE